MVLTNNEIKTSIEEKPMLEQTSWIKINKQNHVLIDEDYKVIATIFTTESESDGDENLIWDVEIESEEFGSYVSLYCAKMAVQKAIAEWDAAIAAQQKKKKVSKKKETSKKKINALHRG